MALLLLMVGLQALGGCGALLARGSRRWSTALGVGGIVAGSVAGLFPAVAVLRGAPPPALDLPWAVPSGAFAVALDALSAFFLLPVLGLSAVAAVYGGEYLQAHDRDRAPGASWFWFALLVASMEIVLLARNAVLFLVAWEAMALSSFFLVTTDDEDASVRDAGWTYLVATHLGTACLLALFVLLGHGADPLSFARFSPAAGAGLLFLLALAGFGAKAGLMPFHVWLPDAHPAAPSHVSALMSGVMIKTGIYGLLRAIVLLGPLPPWAGPLLVAVGATSGVLGILSALAQQDIKRVLAYSSVENVGIVALGLGLGLVGLQAGAPAVAVPALAAALLHVVGHGVMKGLLFLAAGAVAQRTHTRQLDALGGLLCRMPRTGLACVAGSAAIAGLPPLPGFAAEFLLYLAAYRALVAPAAAGALPAVAVITALALLGGLAPACFARLFGIAFLGTPRSAHAAGAGEPGPTMQGVLLVLAAGCAILGVASPVVVGGLVPVLAPLTGLSAAVVGAELDQAAAFLGTAVAAGSALVALTGAIAIARRRLLARRTVADGVTWDCGFAAPSPRMQYTGSSFAQPLAAVFARVVPTRSHGDAVKGFFPLHASFASTTPDLGRERLFQPLFEGIARALARLRWLQHGQVQLYVLYIAAALVLLLVWRIGLR